MSSDNLEELESSSSEEEVVIRRKKIKKVNTVISKELEEDELPVLDGYKEIDMGNENLKPRKESKNYKICDGIEREEDDKEIQKPKPYKNPAKK